MAEGLTEKDGRDFWALFDLARKQYIEDCFLVRSAMVCKLCFKEIKPARRLPNYSQHANIRQSMEGHIKGHIRRGEITWDSIDKAKGIERHV